VNFLLNRLARSSPPEELSRLGEQIASITDCVPVLLAAAERAEAEGRLLPAANYFRGAEFYMATDAPRKREAYDRYIELHDRARPEVPGLRDGVPFEGGTLPVLALPPEGAERGTILMHSGYDGLVEEMYANLVALAEAGYRVIGFEGPGQGGALRLSGLPMPHDWERPVGAVLDHYGIEECTLIGMSLGGYLAPRAAAFEPRIRRVVAWGAMYDFAESFRRNMGPEAFEALMKLVDDGARGQVNAAIDGARKASPFADWAIGHGMHVSGAADPFGFLVWMSKMNVREQSARIEQDVLLVMGNEDHLVALDQVYEQAKALTSARSITLRIASSREQGAEHCQIGNPMLVVDEILRWLEGLDRRDARLADCLPGLLSDAAS
jgi:pimeloyl-ACP methyl ester carboxylesterase